jgi:folate-dependent phosphoribosylglycinamide formyltransferase PurN
VPGESEARHGHVVLLAGPGDTTDIVANALADRVPRLDVVEEQHPSRLELARRRAKRIGWTTVSGQILFVGGALPWLRWRGRNRIAAIVGEAGLDTERYPPGYRVSSVNAQETIGILGSLHPDVVVVNGTRIIARSVLDTLDCPIINVHTGVTPRYRGVHGGYWALAEGRPDLVGTTVHLVDAGIDTGDVLARAPFAVTADDSIATYPYLHLAAGLPLLLDQVDRVLAGEKPVPLVEGGPPGESRLHLHPTLWEYLRHRVGGGVR